MFSERHIQEFIWTRRADWASLLDVPSMPERRQFQSDLSDVTAEALVLNRFVTRLEELLHKVQNVELFGIEVPLERSHDATTRVDFLGSIPGDTAIAIVELKRSRQSEREALTELLGYSQHMGMLFPTLCREDLLLVLISPMESRVVRDAYVQSLIFDGKPIVALQPTFIEPRLDSLRLRPWIPDPATVAMIAKAAFCPDNFDVCKIVWQESSRMWNCSADGAVPVHGRENFDRVSALAAQAMEAEGIHGFCFTSRMWPEIPFPYPNSLVLVGWNPYSVRAAINASQASVPDRELRYWSDGFTDLIPGLLPRARDDHQRVDYLADLRAVWSLHLHRVGVKIVNLSTETTESASLEIDSGFFSWRQYQTQWLEDVTCHNFQVRPTGLIRELYWDLMKIDYDVVRRVGIENHPVHDDMYHDMIEALSSQHFLRAFVERLFAEAEDEADDAGDAEDTA